MASGKGDKITLAEAPTDGVAAVGEPSASPRGGFLLINGFKRIDPPLLREAKKPRYPEPIGSSWGKFFPDPS